MNRIFIDFERIKNPYCGLGQYSISLGQSLARLKPEELELLYFVPPEAQHYFPGNIKFNSPQLYKKYALNPKGMFLPGNIDLWHITNQDSDYFPFIKSGIKLLTIHDLNFLYQNNKSRIKRRLFKLRKKIDQSHHISTISNFVKNELISMYRVPEERISVIYNGLNIQNIENLTPPAFDTGRFLFTIGQVVEKKNFHTLVEMMAFLPQLNLIISGQNENSYARKIEQLISKHQLQNRVHLTGPVSDSTKHWLYAHCDAFVFPSLAEGFGFPPIEAMRAGKPVVLSRATSLPEVAGIHGYYWDNFEAEHMAQVVEFAIRDYQKKNKQQAAVQHALGFNWDNAASQYLSLYSKLLAEKNMRPLISQPALDLALSANSTF